MSAKKETTKHVLIALGIFAGVYILYQMYQAYQAGKTAISDILMAPWNAVVSAWNGITGAASSVANSVSSTASLIANTPANVAAGNAAANQIASMNNSAYAPGGTTYNYIAATQGQPAADAAWQTVQNQEATQASQTVTWDPLTWFS